MEIGEEFVVGNCWIWWSFGGVGLGWSL